MGEWGGGKGASDAGAHRLPPSKADQAAALIVITHPCCSVGPISPARLNLTEVTPCSQPAQSTTSLSVTGHDRPI